MIFVGFSYSTLVHSTSVTNEGSIDWVTTLLKEVFLQLQNKRDPLCFGFTQKVRVGPYWYTTPYQSFYTL